MMRIGLGSAGLDCYSFEWLESEAAGGEGAFRFRFQFVPVPVPVSATVYISTGIRAGANLATTQAVGERETLGQVLWSRWLLRGRSVLFDGWEVRHVVHRSELSPCQGRSVRQAGDKCDAAGHRHGQVLPRV